MWQIFKTEFGGIGISLENSTFRQSTFFFAFLGVLQLSSASLEILTPNKCGQCLFRN